MLLLGISYLTAASEEAVRLRVLVADRMLQLVAQEGGSDAKFVLLLRQLAARFTRMKPASSIATLLCTVTFTQVHAKGCQGCSICTDVQKEVK